MKNLQLLVSNLYTMIEWASPHSCVQALRGGWVYVNQPSKSIVSLIYYKIIKCMRISYILILKFHWDMLLSDLCYLVSAIGEGQPVLRAESKVSQNTSKACHNKMALATMCTSHTNKTFIHILNYTLRGSLQEIFMIICHVTIMNLSMACRRGLSLGKLIGRER
jgi:hypothetical protein